MKKILEQYASYNLWANQKLTEAILKLPEETVNSPIVSSFSSLRLTLLHILTAESIWWQRIKLVENVEMRKDPNQSIGEIVQGLLGHSLEWEAWVKKSTEAGLEHELIYRNSKKEQFKQPVYEILLQVFNHGTYHRGQLVTMLRQLDVSTLPATDFIIFKRRKQ